jgi:putative endonuclease
MPTELLVVYSMTWYVYIIRCSDGTFYTGITTNLDRRTTEHNESAKGAKYTRTRRPVTLYYYEPQPSRSLALRREYQLKQLPAEHKTALGVRFNKKD